MAVGAIPQAAEEGGIMTICKDPAIVAEQILLVEYERFSSIIPQEFIETFVKGQDVRLPAHSFTVILWRSDTACGV